MSPQVCSRLAFTLLTAAGLLVLIISPHSVHTVFQSIFAFVSIDKYWEATCKAIKAKRSIKMFHQSCQLHKSSRKVVVPSPAALVESEMWNKTDSICHPLQLTVRLGIERKASSLCRPKPHHVTPSINQTLPTRSEIILVSSHKTFMIHAGQAPCEMITRSPICSIKAKGCAIKVN